MAKAKIKLALARRLGYLLRMNRKTVPAEPNDQPTHDETDPYVRVAFGLGLKLKPFKNDIEDES